MSPDWLMIASNENKTVKKKIKLLLAYSKGYFILANTVTIIWLWLLVTNGTSAIRILFWTKLIISLIFLSIHRGRKLKEIFFYLNNGLGERPLLLIVLLFDLTIYLLGTITAIKYLI